MINSGSTTFFFDLDIDSDGPTFMRLLFVPFRTNMLSIFSTSSGLNQLLSSSLYVSWQTIPCVNKLSKGSFISKLLLL